MAETEEPTSEDAVKKLMASTGMSKAEATVRIAELTKPVDQGFTEKVTPKTGQSVDTIFK